MDNPPLNLQKMPIQRRKSAMGSLFTARRRTIFWRSRQKSCLLKARTARLIWTHAVFHCHHHRSWQKSFIFAHKLAYHLFLSRTPDQHASPAANDLQTRQTSESDGKSHQSPLMLITSAWNIQETCTPLDRSPTLSPVDDEIIVTPVGSQDSKAGLMVDRIDIREYVGLGGKVQQPGYSRSRSASPGFQKAEMGFSGEKRGKNKSWRRSMADLSEVLSFPCPKWVVQVNADIFLQVTYPTVFF